MSVILLCAIVGIITYYAYGLLSSAMYAIGRFLWDMGIGRP